MNNHSGKSKWLVGAALAGLIIAVSATPALATTANISGTQSPGSVVQWNTPRTNSVTSYVSVKEFNSFTAWGIRRLNGAQFARTEGVYNSWSNFCLNGFSCTTLASFRIPPGTFYLNSAWWGTVTDTWTAQIQWNVPA